MSNALGIGGFKKGISGNSSGRSKRDLKLAELARQYTQEALDIVLEVMRGSDNPTDKLRAAMIILDRGHGRTPPSFEHSDQSRLPITPVLIIGGQKVSD
jgi:hypothetical protein